MNAWVIALGGPVALGAVAVVALAARARRAVRPGAAWDYVPTTAQARWATARRAEIDSESTIIIPAGEAGTAVAQWNGMITPPSAVDHARRR